MLAAIASKRTHRLSSYAGRMLMVCAGGIMLVAMTSGCRPMSLQDATRLATIAKWTGDNRVSIKEVRPNQLWEKAKIIFGYGPEPSQQADVYLRRYDLKPGFARSKLETLKQLRVIVEQEPGLDKEFTLAELAYHEATVAHQMGRKQKAKLWYIASAYHGYRYLFAPVYNNYRNAYSPEFRMTVGYYNESVQGLLRILNTEKELHSKANHQLQVAGWTANVQTELKGPWRQDDFEAFKFANDYQIKGVGNKHQTDGVGVAMIGIRKQRPQDSSADKYYPTGLALPVTAFLRFSESCCEVGSKSTQEISCVIELYDSLQTRTVEVSRRSAPLESDISTPLAYFLQNPLVSTQVLETIGLLDGKLLDEFDGLYMLEPYDPNRVPVVLVHGLWSSPFTWLEMFNELRALPEIREQYQFWFYLYPTGQPFWASAKKMRKDLQQVRMDVDPNREFPTLDQMVLIGHSMGGLVSRLQTVNSGDAFWKILSDRPFEELEADPEIKNEIRDVLFFQANPSVKRLVTIGTPHRGSSFANNFTRWLGQKVIRLPELVRGSGLKKIYNREEILKNTEVLATRTSIDSLSAESPFLSKLLESGSAPWVKTHNIIGNVEKREYFGLAGELKPTGSDGIVSTESSQLENALSKVVVNSKHSEIHQQPRTILEVARILKEHSTDVQIALARHRNRYGQTPIRQPYSTREKQTPAYPDQQATYHQPVENGEETVPPRSGSVQQGRSVNDTSMNSGRQSGFIPRNQNQHQNQHQDQHLQLDHNHPNRQPVRSDLNSPPQSIRPVQPNSIPRIPPIPEKLKPVRVNQIPVPRYR